MAKRNKDVKAAVESSGEFKTVDPPEIDKMAKTAEQIKEGVKPKADPPETEPKRRGRKPGKRKKEEGPILDENAGKMYVAALDATFTKLGLSGIITEQDKAYFSSVTAGGEVSFAKMYAQSFTEFFNTKFKDRVKDLPVFQFYALTLALIGVKVKEAQTEGMFKKLSLWKRTKAVFTRKKVEDNNAPVSTETK
jgi:hypothetical protein